MSRINFYPLLLLLLTIVLLLAASLFAPSVLAHGSGASYEAEVGEYLVDIGYPEAALAGEAVVLDFALLNKEGGNAAFDNVWVRILDGNKTVFATGIDKADLGRSTLTYTFPNEGEYTISANFQDAGGSLAEAEFPVNVQQGAQSAGGIAFVGAGIVRTLLAGVAGAILGVSGALATQRWIIKKK